MPPDAITGTRMEHARQPRGRLDVGPRAGAVARDVGVQDRRRAPLDGARRQIDGVDVGALGPAFDRDLAVARVDRDDDAPGQLAAQRLDELGLLDGAVPSTIAARPRRAARAPPPDRARRRRACTSAPAAAMARSAARLSRVAERAVEIDDVHALGARLRRSRARAPPGAFE